MPETTTEKAGSAAMDISPENARDGARKRRDPNEPAAVVGIGASAGGIAPLQQFFEEMKADSGLAFVVVMHLSADFESQLANVIQQKTQMPVVQVNEPVKVQPNHVYVIPPNHQLTFEESMLRLAPRQQAHGRRVTIDLFFRTLASAYGQRAVSIIMSGTDSDGIIGLKHVRAQGGVTIAQEPEEAEFDSMPHNAIATGMVDWVLRVADMPGRLLQFVRNENAMQLPPEIVDAVEPDAKVQDAPGGETVSDETRDPDDEEALALLLKHVRAHTSHDFSHYKRATVLRRIARRLQVNSLESIPRYLDFLRQHPAEVHALLNDLLIGVTHFFRDHEAFAALQENVPQLFAGKKHTDEVRVWVAGCATGEEAYSIAMLLCEYAEKLTDPPAIQIFATDIDQQAIHDARQGIYPATIEADVSQPRLRRFFTREGGRYRVKKDVRERVLFAAHDVLSDPAFSRLDLVSCRNLLIYLKREAQTQVFELFHFALRAGGLLFVGGAESADIARELFGPLDSHHRIYSRRSVLRPNWRLPIIPGRIVPPRGSGEPPRPMLRRMASSAVQTAGEQTQTSSYEAQERRSVLFGELHLKLLEEYGPPSVVVNEAHDIVHLSEHSGRYLAFRAGEPSTNLLTVVNPALRVELRTALFRAAQLNQNVIVAAQSVPLDGGSETIDLHVRPIRPGDAAEGFFLVLFERKNAPTTAQEQLVERETISRQLDDELQSLKGQLNSTVEQFEASSEELKASNEELQAMNEELRSAAEELETSKEELQSLNEELFTVNQELKEKVEELSHANSDLNALMTSTDLATIFLDGQLRVVRFTPRVHETFNLVASDVGRPISDITHKLRYENLIADAEQVLERLVPLEREIETQDERSFLAHIAPYRTLDDRISGVVVTLVDVTKIRRVEAELRNSEARLQRMVNVARVGVLTFDERGVILHANDALIEMLGYKREEFDSQTFTWRDFTPPEHVALSMEVLEQLRETGRGGPYEKEYFRKDGTRKWMMFVGADLGDGTTVEYAIDVSDRKRAEQAERASEERVRTIADNVPQLIWTNDGEGTANYFNKRWFDYTGLSQEESYGPGWQVVVHPEDAPAATERWKRALTKGEVFDAEYRLRRADGEYRWFIGRNVPLRTNGAVLSWFGSATDIDDLKRAETALRESEEFVRCTLDSFSSMIAIADRSGLIVDINLAWKRFAHENRYTGANDGVGENYLEVTQRAADAGSIEAREVWSGIKSVLSNQSKSFEFEYPCHSPDGRFRWFMVNVSPLATKGGGAVIWHTDITARKQAEEALRETEERFRQFAENSTDVFWIVNGNARKVEYLNPVFEKMWGTARQPILDDISNWAKLVHPEDREKAASALPRVCRGETVTTEYRIVRPGDGAMRWIRDTAFPIRDDGGAIVRVAGVEQDVTDDRERSEQLGLTEERFRLLVEGAREYAMFLLDTSNVIIYWSNGAERVFGWSAEEAIGQSGELIFTPEDRARETEETEIEIALRDGTAPDQRWHMRKDGTRIWVDGVMRRLDDEQTGALRGFAKIARDATEQQQAEEQLRRAHEELEQRVRERTAELREKNLLLQSEMEQRQTLEREIIRITERERARISQDLHDSLCQELTATAFLLKSRSKTVEAQSKVAADSLSEAAATVNKNAGIARDLARGLHPMELGSSGLASALRELCSRTSDHVSCRCDVPRSLRLDQNMALNLYRIAQEAVTNSMKHARANEIAIVLERTDGEIVLTVSDDGQGGRRRAHGLGTQIMHYRARAIGGTLKVESGRGRGTTVTCRVPIRPAKR